MAGGQHHHRTNLDKYHPGYFGKVGMRYFHKTQNKFWKPVVNLDKVRSEGNLERGDTLLFYYFWGDSGIYSKDSLFTDELIFLQLWSLVPTEKREEYVNQGKSDTVPVLDLLPLGYSKVLGKGRLPEIPVVVRARYFSKEAERKIKEAGGVVELVA
jgi:ribosomal protein L15